MGKKTKPHRGGKVIGGRSKGNYSTTPKQQIRSFFLRGERYTARELNRLTLSNDARKCISDLRKEGMPIIDYRRENGTKEYWLQTDKRQLCLFDEKGGAL